jgi:hypothetical protein
MQQRGTMKLATPLLLALFAVVLSFHPTPSHAQSECYGCTQYQGSNSTFCTPENGQDGFLACSNLHDKCPGAECCNPGQNTGYCYYCFGTGDCIGDGCSGCGPDTCCVNGQCYGKTSPQCTGGEISQKPKVFRPSVETLQAFPWLAHAGIVHEIAAHSMNQKVLETVLSRWRNASLVDGVFPNRYAVLKESETMGYVLAFWVDEAKNQNIKIWTYNPSAEPNPKPPAVRRGTEIHPLLEELIIAQSEWTLKNANGTSTGKIEPYNEVPDPKACSGKKSAAPLVKTPE